MNYSKKQEWWCVDFGQGEYLEKETFNALAEIFFRLTLNVVVGENRLFLEMSETRHLFNLNSLMTRVCVLAEQLGVNTMYWKWGVGKSIPEAWVQTRYRARASRRLPLAAYFDYIDPLNHFELNRSMRDRIFTFSSLGLKNLADIFETPKEAWLVLLEEEFDVFLEHYSYPESFPWVKFVPPLKLVEEVDSWSDYSEVG